MRHKFQVISISAMAPNAYYHEYPVLRYAVCTVNIFYLPNSASRIQGSGFLRFYIWKVSEFLIY